MEIRNKPALEEAVRNKISKFIKEFPLYFFINILINIALVLITTMLFLMEFFAIKARMNPEFNLFVPIAMLGAVMSVTFKGFLRNARILRNLVKHDYEFEIERHEMDNALEMMEDFPTKKNDLQRIKISLSFGKIIDVLIAARIISCYKGMYDFDPIFRNEVRDAFREKIPEAGYVEKPRDEYGKNWRFWR